MKVMFDDVRINEVESAEGTCCVLRSKDRVSKCESCSSGFLIIIFPL